MHTRASALWSLVLVLSGCDLFSGGAEHPDPGKASPEEYCSSGPAEEQNCSRCASKAGCGFCQDPRPGAPVCQPGTSTQTASDGCRSELLISTEDCAPPPPPVEGY